MHLIISLYANSQKCLDIHILFPTCVPTSHRQYLPMKFFTLWERIFITIEISCIFPLSLAALVPGQVQNLRSTLDPDILTLTLNWDKPSNVTTAEEVTAYDIRFRPTGSLLRKGYRMVTVDYPATSILLTRENGLNSLTRYDFEVRAWNASCEGEWSQVSKYIGMFIQC